MNCLKIEGELSEGQIVQIPLSVPVFLGEAECLKIVVSLKASKYSLTGVSLVGLVY